MTDRPDDELPESRRAYVPPPMRPVPPPTPAQAARNAREGQGLERLTGAEQLVVGAGFVGYWTAHTVATRPFDSGYTTKEFFALIVPLAAMNLLTMVYMEWRPPWPGPSWWVARLERRSSVTDTRSSDPVRLSRTRAMLSRFGRWWIAPGRLGLAVALLGVLFVGGALADADSDDALIKDLRARGIEATATITDLDFAPRVGRTAVEVRFVVDGDTRSQSLSFLDGEAQSAPEGAHVTVVYDPVDPSHVLLAGQLHGRQVRNDHTVAWLSGSVAVAGFIWWVVQSPHRRRDPERPTPN